MRSGRTSERATSHTASSVAAIAASTSTMSRTAAARRSAARSSTALITDPVFSLISRDAISSVVRTESRSTGLLGSTCSGSDMIAIRVTNCCCSVLASGESTPSTSLIPNSVDGSVPASVIIELRSSGSGSSPPRLSSSSCIIIWPRAPTARLSPSVCARMRSLSSRTEPLMASSAVSRIGA